MYVKSFVIKMWVCNYFRASTDVLQSSLTDITRVIGVGRVITRVGKQAIVLLWKFYGDISNIFMSVTFNLKKEITLSTVEEVGSVCAIFYSRYLEVPAPFSGVLVEQDGVLFNQLHTKLSRDTKLHRLIC